MHRRWGESHPAEMRRSHSLCANMPPSSKSAPAAIDREQIPDVGFVTGIRPIQEKDTLDAKGKAKYTARQLLKGHPYSEIKPNCVADLLSKHVGERHQQNMLLFALRGSLPSTLDIGSGGDHWQGAFTHTLSIISQVSNQASDNQMFITKADQRDGCDDLVEMTGHFAAIFESLEKNGVPVPGVAVPVGFFRPGC